MNSPGPLFPRERRREHEVVIVSCAMINRTLADFAIRLTSFVLAMILIVSCGAEVSAQARDRVASSYSSIQTPRAPIDIMRNLKIAIDDQLFLRRDFYTDETLTRFFGSSKIRWDLSNVDPIRLWGYAHDFPGPLKPNSTDGSEALDGLTVRFRLTASSAGLVEADISIEFVSPRLERPSFSDIEGLFGSGWVIEFVLSPLVGQSRRTPTAPHGNELIVYENAVGPVSVLTRFLFSFDGRVESSNTLMRGPAR